MKAPVKSSGTERSASRTTIFRATRSCILDEGGAETLLGQGDLLYKDANSQILRLQVPYLDNEALKRCLRGSGGKA